MYKYIYIHILYTCNIHLVYIYCNYTVQEIMRIIFTCGNFLKPNQDQARIKLTTFRLHVLIYTSILYLTNRLHFPVCVYCNRSQMTSQRVKNKKVRESTFFTRCDVFCDLLQYTYTEKCYLFVLYNKNSNGLLKDFGGHEKRKTSLLT